MQTSQAAPSPQMLDEKKKTVRRPIWVKLRPTYPFIVILALWQVAAMQAQGNQGKLFPTVDAIVYRAWELVTAPLFRELAENPNLGLIDQFLKLLESPILLHTIHTAWRLPFAFFIAAVVGTIVGIMMGRFAFWEAFFVPLLSVLLPIPAIAWTPIVVIWAGIGDQTVIVITAFASFLPIAMAVWTGVKTVNPVWIRAAQSMNADKMTIFRTVVLPGIAADDPERSAHRPGARLARRGRSRGVRRHPMGTFRRHLRRAGIPGHRVHDGRALRPRSFRFRSRKDALPAHRKPHRHPLGHDGSDGRAGQESVIKARTTNAYQPGAARVAPGFFMSWRMIRARHSRHPSRHPRRMST